MKRYIWLLISNDKYELPLVIANSAKELAEILGTTSNNIVSSYNHYLRGDLKTCPYRRVED